MNTKPIWQSRTFWANLVMIGGVIANHFWGIELDVESETIIVGVAMGVINLVLRLRTNTAIGK